MKNRKFAFLVILTMLLSIAMPIFSATSAFAEPVEYELRSYIEQHGIKWYFAEPAQTGQFVNGDWWVVGPIEITNITPETNVVEREIVVGGTPRTIQRAIHGTMVNPVVATNAQGFDSNLGQHHGHGNTYVPSLNVALDLPRVFAPGDSIMSSISNFEREHLTPQNFPQQDVIAVLTVVNTPVPIGTFRPPSHGAHIPTRWHVDDLDFSRLHSLTPPPDVHIHDIEWVTELFSLPTIEVNTTWAGRNMRPFYNSRSLSGHIGAYGREISNLTAMGVLLLQLDFSDEEKLPLLINMVQYGIDLYGAIRAGARWHNDGGHNMGRKMPLILAGHVLHDTDILRFANAQDHFYFQEDQSTFIVSQSDIGHNTRRQQVAAGDGRRRDNYTEEMIGTPEWGEKHTGEPWRNGANWCVGYRQIAGAAFLGHVLTAHIMGLREVWNWEPLFLYSDRFVTVLHQEPTEDEPQTELERAGVHTNAIIPFVARMWEEHRYAEPVDWEDKGGGELPPITHDVSLRSLTAIDFTDGRDYIIIGSTTTNTITIPASFRNGTITLQNVNINLATAPPAGTGPLILSAGSGGAPGSNVNLVFEGENMLGVNGWFGNTGGIHVPVGSEITISAKDDNDEYVLRAFGGNNNAGIFSGGTVTINSGTIISNGRNSAGIGGGFGAPNPGSIIINGGNVTATGGNNGAGIGGGGHSGGINGSGGNITINGGVVTATGVDLGAGIGGGGGRGVDGGSGGSSGNITITGGTVIANSPLGAGIGGGGALGNAGLGANIPVNGGAVDSIIISGGTVTARVTNSSTIGGAPDAISAAIGGGGAGQNSAGFGIVHYGGNVVISGGDIRIFNNGVGVDIGGGTTADELSTATLNAFVVLPGAEIGLVNSSGEPVDGVVEIGAVDYVFYLNEDVRTAPLFSHLITVLTYIPESEVFADFSEVIAPEFADLFPNISNISLGITDDGIDEWDSFGFLGLNSFNNMYTNGDAEIVFSAVRHTDTHTLTVWETIGGAPPLVIFTDAQDVCDCIECDCVTCDCYACDCPECPYEPFTCDCDDSCDITCDCEECPYEPTLCDCVDCDCVTCDCYACECPECPYVPFTCDCDDGCDITCDCEECPYEPFTCDCDVSCATTCDCLVCLCSPCIWWTCDCDENCDRDCDCSQCPYEPSWINIGIHHDFRVYDDSDSETAEFIVTYIGTTESRVVTLFVAEYYLDGRLRSVTVDRQIVYTNTPQTISLFSAVLPSFSRRIFLWESNMMIPLIEVQ